MTVEGGARIPAVQPGEVARLDGILAGAGRRVTGRELAQRGGHYRLVDRKALVGELLELVDAFVVERIRQAERELGKVLVDRENEARSDGQHRVLVSLAELADLVDSVVTRVTDAEGAVAMKALDKRIDRIFKSYGFDRIRTVGTVFDSRVHEAVDEAADPDVETGVVVEEVSRGYARDNYVVRVARVIVAS